MQNETNLPEEKLTYHLAELRKTVLASVVALAVFFPLGYFLSPYCIDFLIERSLPPQIGSLNFFSPMEVFVVDLKVGFILSFIICFPFIIWKCWKFLAPALYEKEKNFLKRGVFASSFLFLCGVCVCVFFVLPLLMNFSMQFASDKLHPVLGLSKFLNLSGLLMLAFGIMFQFPVAVFLFVRLGIVSASSLRNKRPYVIVLILILAAILTPPDVVSQLLLAVPTWILFEFGLFFAGKTEKNEEKTKK